MPQKTFESDWWWDIAAFGDLWEGYSCMCTVQSFSPSSRTETGIGTRQALFGLRFVASGSTEERCNWCQWAAAKLVVKGHLCIFTQLTHHYSYIFKSLKIGRKYWERIWNKKSRRHFAILLLLYVLHCYWMYKTRPSSKKPISGCFSCFFFFRQGLPHSNLKNRFENKQKYRIHTQRNRKQSNNLFRRND